MFEIKEELMFFNSIFTLQIKNLNNEEIIKNIYDLKNNDTGRIVSNSGGWQSNDLDLKDYRGYSSLYQLGCEMKNVANFIVNHTGISDKVDLDNFWCNINKNKDSNFPHSHPFTKLSGVYYSKVPEKSGRIVFKRPDNQMFYFVPKRYSEYTYETYMYYPKEGEAIFFPAYLVHHVESNETDQDRISVAFNFI